MESAFIQFVMGIGGFSGAMLLVWFITQTQNKAMVKTITDQNKDQIRALTEQYGKMIDFQRDANKQNYELQERILDLAQMQIASLSRIETKIDNNTSCPVARRGGV